VYTHLNNIQLAVPANIISLVTAQQHTHFHWLSIPSTDWTSFNPLAMFVLL